MAVVAAKARALIVGFTGTQRGMTERQGRAFGLFLQAHATEFHHGDCIGADFDAHRWALLLGIPVVLHPPSEPRKRAWCRGCVRELPPAPYMVRNQAIVDACDVLVATPGEYVEQLRSGTWSTVRKARRAAKQIVIVFPDGMQAMPSASPDA